MSQSGALTVNTGGGAVVETLTGNSGGPVGPDGSFNINLLGNNSTGINVIGNPGTSTLTITAFQATTSQEGTVTLATDAQAIAGTDTANALTSSNLAAKLGTQTIHNVAIFEGTSGALNAVSPSTAGFVLTSNGVGSDPSFQAVSASGAITTITGNSGGPESPLAGNFNIVGTGSITVVGSANTETVQLTGLTNHSLLVGAGTATITNLGVASNGQLPIGSTGVDPVLATLSAGTGISITNGAGSITIAATGTTTLNYTSVNHAASPYTVLATDDYLGVNSTAGVVSILLPNAPSIGRVFIVKDSNGQAVTNNITVTTVGGVVTIDGATTYVMKTNFQSNQFIFNGTSYEVF